MESATKTIANRVDSVKKTIRECADIINELVQIGQLQRDTCDSIITKEKTNIKLFFGRSKTCRFSLYGFKPVLAGLSGKTNKPPAIAGAHRVY